jgi:hypothetical protein
MVAGPILLATDNGAAVYSILSGILIGSLGWLTHPWGLQRSRAVTGETSDTQLIRWGTFLFPPLTGDATGAPFR